MAKVIGSLAVRLGLNSKAFTTGMQRASEVTQRFAGSVARAGVAVAKYGAVAAGVAATGLAAVVKSQMSAIDSTAKTADKLGMTTEALIGLRHAAEMSGVAAGTMDMAMQRMVRRLGEAALGGGPAAKALQEMGLSAEELVQKSPEQALGDIADAMNKLPGPADRVRAAFALFDSEGVNLVNTLAGGSAGLREAAAEADRLGLSLSRVDAAKVEMAGDAISRLQALFTGAAQALTVEVVPFIEAAATKLLEFGLQGENASERITKGIEWVTTAIATVSDYVSLGKAAFYGLQSAATKAISWIVQGIGKLIDGINAVADLLGINVGDSRFFKTFAEELDRAASESLAKSGKAFEDFMTGAAAKSVKATFDQIRADAEVRAEEIAAMAADRAEIRRAIEVVVAEREEPAEEKAEEIRTAAAALGPLELIEAGSAEAQRAAFAAIADSIRVPAGEDIGKQQLTEQKRTVDVLREIHQTLQGQRVEVVSL